LGEFAKQAVKALSFGKAKISGELGPEKKKNNIPATGSRQSRRLVQDSVFLIGLTSVSLEANFTH
jgi:hypothetical protein